MNEIITAAIPLTKKSIEQAGRDFTGALLENGNTSPLDAYIRLRALRDALDVALSDLAPEALAQAERDPKETLHGVGWQVRGGRTVFDYSHDWVWAEIKAREQVTADERKAREKFLQSLPGEMVDPETGEFVTPAAVKSQGAATLALLFPKGV